MASINFACLEITIIHAQKGRCAHCRPYREHFPHTTVLDRPATREYSNTSTSEAPGYSTSAAADACHFQLELQLHHLRPFVLHYLAWVLVRTQRQPRGRIGDTPLQRGMRACPK
jgi:hypothetical protein